MTLTIRHRIQASFALLIGLVVLMCAIGYVRLDRIERHTSVGVLQDSLPSVKISAELEGTLATEHALAQADSRRPEVRDERRANLDKLARLLAAYEPTVRTDEERQTFAAAKSAVTSYLAQPDGARDEDSYRRAQDAVDQMAAWNANHARDEAGQVVAAVDVLRIGALIILAVLVGVGVGCAFLLGRAIMLPLEELRSVMSLMRQGDLSRRAVVRTRDELGDLTEGFNKMADEITGLVGQVQASGVQVNASVTEIAATARQQQATASEIAATTVQIGATSKEISATARELSRTMAEVFSVAEQTAHLATAGQAGLGEMEQTMNRFVEAAASINAKLAVLNDRAGNINQVVTTITKVADQTNLLSLNAAIEAEKAGEYGRGFAVVATEIRRLADQTGVATFDIEQMVKEIQTAISAGVMGMDKFSDEVRQGMRSVEQVGAQLSQIIQQVQALAPEFETVNDGMQTQATGAEQISQALVQLTEAAQQTVESLQQSNSAIEDLSQVSGGLRGSIANFKVAA